MKDNSHTQTRSVQPRFKSARQCLFTRYSDRLFFGTDGWLAIVADVPHVLSLPGNRGEVLNYNITMSLNRSRGARLFMGWVWKTSFREKFVGIMRRAYRV